MKKNILSIIVIALLIINIVLNVVMLFAIVPSSKKASKLIDKVASAIDIEIESDTEGKDYEISYLVPYVFTSENLTISLKKMDGDNKDRYAVITGISISLNTKDEDYETVSAYITSNEIKLKDIILSTFAKYDKDYAQNHVEDIKEEILVEFASKDCLDSDVVVDISFGNLAFQ